jgi:hypothetical protein
MRAGRYDNYRQPIGIAAKSIHPSTERKKLSMGSHTHRALRCTAASRAGRIAIAVFSVAIWSRTIEGSHAADAPVPSAAKLERITEFFNNEVATRKLPGAVVLIQQHGRPVGSGTYFGVDPSWT